MRTITSFRLWLVVAMMSVLVTLNSCERPQPLKAGDYCRVRGTDSGHVAIACRTQQDYAEWTKAASTKDFNTLERLSKGGRGFALPDDIVVKVLATDHTMAQVVVLEGRNSGGELWLPTDHLINTVLEPFPSPAAATEPKSHVGILDWLFGSQAEKDNRRVAAMMRWYAESDVNELVVSEHDAQRLARAALKIDPDNAELKFRLTALEISELGFSGKVLLDYARTHEKNTLVDGALTLAVMKLPYGDQKLLFRMLDALPPEAAQPQPDQQAKPADKAAAAATEASSGPFSPTLSDSRATETAVPLHAQTESRPSSGYVTLNRDVEVPHGTKKIVIPKGSQLLVVSRAEHVIGVRFQGQLAIIPKSAVTESK